MYVLKNTEIFSNRVYFVELDKKEYQKLQFVASIYFFFFALFVNYSIIQNRNRILDTFLRYSSPSGPSGAAYNDFMFCTRLRRRIRKYIYREYVNVAVK